MALILRCLQQTDCETIPSETSVAIMISILKKINVLPLNCNHDQRECASKGLEVIQAFLEIPSSAKTAHATYYDLLREVWHLCLAELQCVLSNRHSLTYVSTYNH